MKAGTLLLALAILAAFIAAHWFLYRPRFEANLTNEATEALRAASKDAGAGLDNVTVTFHALDATLTGTVPSLEARARAQRIVDNLPGARALDADNRLAVVSRLASTISGNALALSGYLPDGGLKTRTLTFIKARRPNLDIDTSGLIISEHAAPLTFPEDDAFPGWLDGVWRQIQEPAFLKIIHTGPSYAVEGLLPDRKLRDDLLDTLADARADTNFNTENLRVSDHATHPDFLSTPKMLDFLSACIALPDPGNIALSHTQLQYGGSGTAAQQRSIDDLAGELGIGAEPESSFTLFPSVYHVPGYRPESTLTPETLKKLRNALDLARVTFKTGSSTVSEEQTARLDAAAAAIAEAGPGIKLVVGAHPDIAGNTNPGEKERDDDANRRMCEARARTVIDALVERGIDKDQLEPAAFDPTPPGNGPGKADTPSPARRVDILVK